MRAEASAGTRAGLAQRQPASALRLRSTNRRIIGHRHALEVAALQQAQRERESGDGRSATLAGMPHRLSIVMPVLDEAGRIGDALAALALLRAQGVELIVVDGGSRDATVARVEDRADCLLTAPRGRARQMNAGAAVAAGDVLLFLHADTALPADALSLVRAALERSAWGRFDVRIDGRSRWLPVVAALMNFRSRATGIATGDQAIFVRRAAFDAVGGFPDQALMEDIELSKRLRARAGPPACLRAKVVTSGRRWDERGAMRTVLLMWRLRWLYWRGVSADRLAAAYR
jgi:rSAM/selenodomain-associated transferase 2